MEDILIGRRSRAISRQVALTVASGRILFGSPYRRMIVVGPTSGPNVWINFDTAAVVGQGILVVGNSMPIFLDVEHVGDMVIKEWFAIAEVGTPTINLIEVVLPEGLI